MAEPNPMPPIDLTVAGTDHIPPLAADLFETLEDAGVALTSEAEKLITDALVRTFGLGARAGIGELSASLEQVGLAKMFNEFHFIDPSDPGAS